MQESGREQLAGASPTAVNVIVDGKGAVRRRPGIATYSGAPSSAVDSSGIRGLYLTAGGELFAVGAVTGSSARIYRVTAGGASSLSEGPSALLNGAQRPIFAETEALLVFATGGDLQKVDLVTFSSARLGGSPPVATHVIANNSRLLANNAESLNRINYSDQASGSSITGHETWDGSLTSGFFPADARPDTVVALHENTNEVFAFGTTNVQAFAPDPSITYASVTTREYGCSAPYSVIKVDQRFAWLDHQRRIVVSDGRGIEIVSAPIQQTLHDMTTATDAFGYRVFHGPVDCLVWTFPTDGRTFAYQIGGGWAEWLSWNDGTNNWQPFPVTAHTIRPDTGQNLVGTSAGKIGVLKSSAQDDLGTLINAHVTTGFVDRENSRRKWCKHVKLVLKRGFATSSTAPVGFLQYRDDYGAWQDMIPVSFGGSGDHVAEVPIDSLGIYRRRQWRFTFSGSEEFVLAEATEDYDVLDQ
jgi:hypothetical protein